MNETMGRDPRDETEADADALHARNVLRGTPAPPPASAYRVRLKEAFRSGAIEHPAEGSTEHAVRQVPVVPLPRRRQSAVWTGFAVAAAIVVVVLAGVLNQGPAWRVTAARGDGGILLDGQSIAAADPAGGRGAAVIGRRVSPGVRIEVPAGAELNLMADGVISMQLTGGTDLIVPPTPPRWFGRRSDLHVRQGEIRVTTGPAFHGARLAVTTPDALLHVTGTTFAVILEPTGTCVCVFEGSVQVGRRSGASMAPVSEGNRRYIFRDGRAPEDDSMRDVERDKLSMFREAQMTAMAGATRR